MDTETKTGIDAAKITSKRLVQKLAESTRDLNGNKKADKITSAGKAKSEEKEDETNKRQEIYIPSGTKQQKVGDFRLFKIQYENRIPKNISLLETTSDNVPTFLTKKLVEVHNQSGEP